MPQPTNDLLSLIPDSIIELYVLDLSPIGENVQYRFCNWVATGGANIVFQGSEYLALPLQANGFEINSRGQLPTPQIEFSNVLGVITSFALTYDDLIGADNQLQMPQWNLKLTYLSFIAKLKNQN